MLSSLIFFFSFVSLFIWQVLVSFSLTIYFLSFRPFLFSFLLYNSNCLPLFFTSCPYTSNTCSLYLQYMLLIPPIPVPYSSNTLFSPYRCSISVLSHALPSLSLRCFPLYPRLVSSSLFSPLLLTITLLSLLMLEMFPVSSPYYLKKYQAGNSEEFCVC